MTAQIPDFVDTERELGLERVFGIAPGTRFHTKGRRAVRRRS